MHMEYILRHSECGITRFQSFPTRCIKSVNYVIFFLFLLKYKLFTWFVLVRGLTLYCTTCIKQLLCVLWYTKIIQLPFEKFHTKNLSLISLSDQVLLSLLKLNYPQNMHLLSAIQNANNAFRMVFKKSNYII